MTDNRGLYVHIPGPDGPGPVPYEHVVGPNGGFGPDGGFGGDGGKGKKK